MCGKSAHGRGGKYGYYEHSWASKRGSVLASDTLKCDPHRVSATKLEKVVLENVTSLLSHPVYAEKLIEKAHEIHKNDSVKKDISNIKKKISGYQSNLEALSERFAQLPKSVSASLIFKQMEKLERAKEEAEGMLFELQKNHHACDELPADWESYKGYLELIKRAMDETTDPELKSQLIKKLVHKIEVGIDSVRIHPLHT